MSKYIGVILIFFCCITVQAQFQTVETQGSFRPDHEDEQKEQIEIGSLREKVKKDSLAPIKDYKIISIKNDTIVVDTALSVKKHYEFNYLRKDPFGLLQFSNEGQTYNVLKYNFKPNQVLPGFGFEAKQFAYLNVDDIKYYSAPTPYTELYYRSVMKQGQNLDAFITLNTSENLNFFVGYKGLRSLGKYIHQLSSTGNFRIGSSYQSPNKKYLMRTHFTAQDILNYENGGIRDLDLFESSVPPYNKRERLNVYYRDVETMLKGKRLYLNHQYQLNNSFENGILLTHEFTYEDKFFEYKQGDINNQFTDKKHFGDAFQSSINNKTRYYNLFNRFGAAFQSSVAGRFEGFVDMYKYRYHYKSIAHIGGTTIPDQLDKNIMMLGGRYIYHKDNWKANVLASTSLGNDETRNIQANLDYSYTENIAFSLGYQNLNRMGNLSYYLYQSDYVNYNWYNDFNNEKINQFDASVTTPWIKLSGTYSVLKDKLYFSNDADEFDKFGIPQQVLTTPKQYGGTINYLSIQAEKDFRVGKFGLDNTVLYQKVSQDQNILNVPEFVTRNTLYFTDAFFDKALKFQTGITFSYFSKYYGNDYNPLIGDFFVQDKVEIGNYPVFDFFINMKIRTARIYLMLEHFNSSLTGYKYYSAPNNPYKDLTFRFGITWNFFT